MLKSVLSILLWIVPVLWVAFAAWSWRFVRRHELRTSIRGLRAFPGLGMGGFGVVMWLYMAAMQSQQASGGAALSDAVGTGAFWREMAIGLVIGYPIYLWSDFLFRQGFAWLFGLRRDAPAAAPTVAGDEG